MNPAQHVPPLRYSATIDYGVMTPIRHHAGFLETMTKFPDVLVHHYEQGELIVADAIALLISDSEWSFIDSIDPSPTDLIHLKKAKEHNMLLPVDGSFDKHVLRFICDGDKVRARRLQEIVVRVNAQLSRYIRELFPTYKFIDSDITWRLTPNAGEPMHYDFYGRNDDPYHHVRLFINIDTKPRLWGVSHRIDDMIRLYPNIAAKLADKHPNKVAEELTKMLPWGNVPRHFVSFAPGNAWLVDSRKVAHEIIFGRKMIACSFYVDTASMCDTEKQFVRVTQKAMEGLQNG